MRLFLLFFVLSINNYSQDTLIINKERNILLERIDSLERTIVESRLQNINEKDILYHDLLEHSEQQISWFLTILAIVGFLLTLISSICYFLGWKTIKKLAKDFLENELAIKIENFESELQKKENEYSKEVNYRIENLEEELKLNRRISNLFDEANKYASRGDTYNEIKIYDKILDLEPDSVKAKGNKGSVLINTKKVEQGLQYFEEILKENPEDPIAWNNKGVALGNLGRNKEEIYAYNKVIEIDDSFASAYYNIACSLSIQKKMNKKVYQNLQRAIDLDSNFKKQARKDSDFKKLWKKKAFLEITE